MWYIIGFILLLLLGLIGMIFEWIIENIWIIGLISSIFFTIIIIAALIYNKKQKSQKQESVKITWISDK